MIEGREGRKANNTTDEEGKEFENMLMETVYHYVK
jgi:hypothetical protein